MWLALVERAGADNYLGRTRAGVKKLPARGGPGESKGGNLVARLLGVTCKRSGIVHGKY